MFRKVTHRLFCNTARLVQRGVKRRVLTVRDVFSSLTSRLKHLQQKHKQALQFGSNQHRRLQRFYSSAQPPELLWLFVNQNIRLIQETGAATFKTFNLIYEYFPPKKLCLDSFKKIFVLFKICFSKLAPFVSALDTFGF